MYWDELADGVLYSSVKRKQQNIFALMSCVYNLHHSSTHSCAA